MQTNSTALGLVFQYFFTAGAGIGAGLVVTVGAMAGVYQFIKSRNQKLPTKRF